MITTQIQEFFTNYLQSQASLDVINQNEHTGRTPLENLLNQLKPEYIEITHEGKRNVDGLGAPDFTVNQSQKATVVGYIENKKIDENLNKILKSKQIEKYQKLSENLILTDYLEWIWLYKDNDPVRVRLCESDELTNKKLKLNPKKANELYNLIQNFYSIEAAKITTAKELAQKLARPSVEIKKYLIQEIDFQAKTENQDQRDELYGVYEIFRDGLFEDLSSRDFADGFAQMLTYSVFLAKLNTNETLTLSNVKNSIPEAFSLIKTLDKFLDLLSENRHRQIKWAVENILSVINNIDSLAIGESLGSKFGDEEKDPYIYFYEDFLREYDSEVRMDRGVYYTPPAVVQFIVNRVSQLLEEDFELVGGIKNSQVKILDFACGTGTFLFESYKQVLSGTQVGSFEQNKLIGHLLNNFYGFEIMISSYIISHLKLSQFLKEKGYDLATKNNQRIGVYLTNTLDSKQDFPINYTAKAVAEEGKKAKQIKEDNQIIAIIGNPPYNSSSQNTLHDGKGENKSEKDTLKAFHQNYKPADEKNINSLSDDYIKFIAFAHQKINRSGKGIVGMIVNNSFLKGLTHRKMRNELLKDFDKIYVVDLHGNARIGETSPDGTADQNVFDIMQGVCIIILVKNPNITDKGVYQIDLYGKRKQKLKALSELTLPVAEGLSLQNSPVEAGFIRQETQNHEGTPDPSFKKEISQLKQILQKIQKNS
jgi:predicted helicase